MPTGPPNADDSDIDAWCRAHLRSGVRRRLLRAGYLSTVVGVELADGRPVVIKVRQPHARLAACYKAQSMLWQAGFPCPQPLVSPTPLGPWAASAEAYVPGGAALPATRRAAPPFADGLALLLKLAPAPAQIPSFDPKPPWTAWNHGDPGLWPKPDDWGGDLNSVGGPAWVDEAAHAARSWLRGGSGPAVVGHGDWYAENLRWAANRLFVAHDWDSLLVDREAIIAGFASAVFCTVTAGTDPTPRESAEFIAAFEQARGAPFSEHERADAWAAGLWLRAFDAKKQVAKGEPVRSLSKGEARERRNHFDSNARG